MDSSQYDAVEELLWLQDKICEAFLAKDINLLPLPAVLDAIKEALRESTIRLMNK